MTRSPGEKLARRLARRERRAAGEEDNHDCARDRSGDASEERVERDFALEQVGELKIGLANSMHDLDREAMSVSAPRAARTTAAAAAPLTSKTTRLNASHWDRAHRAKQRREPVDAPDLRCRGAIASGSALDRIDVRRRVSCRSSPARNRKSALSGSG